MKKIILWGILLFVAYKLYEKYTASKTDTTTKDAGSKTDVSEAVSVNPGSSSSGNLLDPGAIIVSANIPLLNNLLID